MIFYLLFYNATQIYQDIVELWFISSNFKNKIKT